ncbi:MAG: hypothetical protein ACRD26_24750 [Vicinamibacterales bacterium]
MDEGLEETLTLHRLGVFRELGTSLKTTNALESIHARVESRVAKVDHWRNSEQKQRWLATALLDIEPRLRRIKNFRARPLLREALKRSIDGAKKPAAYTRGVVTEFQLGMALTRPTRVMSYRLTEASPCKVLCKQMLPCTTVAMLCPSPSFA